MGCTGSFLIQKKAMEAGRYDVVVCGGGVSGFAAAVSAAREGLKTAVVEQMSFFGGTATGGLVVPISGFYHNGRRVAGGIGWELICRLEEAGAAVVELPKGHVSVNIEYMKLFMQRMLVESGADLYTNCVLSDCILEGEQVTAAVIESKNGTEVLFGDCFIDATGDGALCHLAKVPMMEERRELQPMSLCFVMGGVDLTTDLMKNCIHHDGKNGSHSCNREIEQFLKDRSDEVKQFGGPWFNTLLWGDGIAVNVTRSKGNGADRAELTAAELKLREDMFSIAGLLKEHYPEFANSYIITSGMGAGIRESRHILGLETVTGQDLISGRTYPCPVACCAHPMDMHRPNDSGQTLIPLPHPAYVPHKALIPRKVNNVAAAGRCISADEKAYASLRVQATMMSMGEAAGLMARQFCEGERAMDRLSESKLSERFLKRGFLNGS
ncbi:MAG: FAD-dependent oxidoreductase [Hungatella sp.]|nr:FAD-dependent oxidoreductase [Hungatella sp.]